MHVPHTGTAAFQLPAENVSLAEPGLQGVAVSGPSFKMMRGGGGSQQRAAMLRDLNTGSGRLLGSQSEHAAGDLSAIPESRAADMAAMANDKPVSLVASEGRCMAIGDSASP